jgi:hypothetical protein
MTGHLLGAPLGPPEEVAFLTWERNFTHAQVRFEAHCSVNPRNCSLIRWRQNHTHVLVPVALTSDEVYVGL